MKDLNQQLKEKIAELEQQKEIIRQQEEFLRSIYDNVQEAIFVLDIEADGTFRYQGFNPAAVSLTGIANVVGKTPEQVFPPEIVPLLKQRYRECIESKAAISYEECLPFQGQDTWWLTTLNPLENDQGNIYRIIGTSLNISDRKAAETELDQEKNFLKALLDNLSDGIVACNEQGILTLFNRATRELHGLPAQPIPAKDWAEHYALYLPDGITPMSQQEIPLFRALQGESIRDVEMMIVPKEGQPRIILANGDPILNHQGQKIGAIAAIRDITEWRQAELELEQERVFIKAMLDNLSDGIVACDAKGILASFNRASRELFVVPQEPLPPEQWAEHYHLYDVTGKAYLKQAEIPLSRAFAGESFIDAELMAMPPGGKPRNLLANGSPIIDSRGHKIGAVVAVRDITERKQAELALAQLNDELEERVKQRTNQLEQVNALLLVTTATLEKRNQELDQFAYVTSHDLKAPLRAIANLSTWIEEDLEGKLDEDSKYNLSLLRNRVQRLENLINGLLDYSRVGRVSSKPQTVAVEEMIAEIIDMLQMSDSCQVKVESMPTLVTDAIALQQIFRNLMSNAIKHGDSEKCQIRVSVQELEDYYEFAVTDNGKGIAPQYHERIFTIFQTLEARDTKESTGIGLSIVKKAVENQGGKITVESAINQGCTFRFTWQKGENLQ
ncbi:MAG: PAS domain-containing protein [Cyanobacteria bacterium P01_C01_bin.72]